MRREQRALQQYGNLSFHTSENPTILFYRKAARPPVVQWPEQEPVAIPLKIATQLAEDAGRVDDGESAGDILVAVNTDPANVQEGIVHVPIEDMGIGDDEPYVVHDLLTGTRYIWRGARNYVRLDPAEQPGHLFLVERTIVSSRAIPSRDDD